MFVLKFGSMILIRNGLAFTVSASVGVIAYRQAIDKSVISSMGSIVLGAFQPNVSHCSVNASADRDGFAEIHKSLANPGSPQKHHVTAPAVHMLSLTAIPCEGLAHRLSTAQR